MTGAETALGAGVHPLVAVAMGVTTATFGGILRDVLSGEDPVILSREIYVTAALIGSATYVLLSISGVGREISLLSGFAYRRRNPALRAALELDPAALPPPQRQAAPTEVSANTGSSGATDRDPQGSLRPASERR